MTEQWACLCGSPFEPRWRKGFWWHWRYCQAEGWLRKLLKKPKHDIVLQSADGAMTCTKPGRALEDYAIHA